jgi:hypothetical protein
VIFLAGILFMVRFDQYTSKQEAKEQQKGWFCFH